VYVHYPRIEGMPIKELKAFKRIPLKINEERVTSFSIALSELKKWDDAKHTWKSYDGDYTITAGSNSADERLTAVINIKNAE
jgi:beta-glucosidase